MNDAHALGAGAAGPQAPPSASPGLLTVVALAGAGTMVVELSAVRLLAPWFGASVGVWTNVIGVVLLALSLGYLLGARLAAGRRPALALGLALLVAAGTSAWLPAAAGLVAERFLPTGVPLDRAAELVTWGSLASACVLFLPAALALGCVGPLAVELVQVRGRLHAGTAGGRVLFASTLGSLAGTFGTTHLLLPVLGLRWTFSLAAAVLAVLGLVVLLGYRRGGPLALLLALAVPAGLFAPPRTRPDVPEGLELLAARESPYQSVRVVQTVGEEPLRFLQVNESFDSFQSVWQKETGLLPRGFYYNAFALPPWWSERREAWRVLVLGLGAGTAWRVLEGTLPPGTGLVAEGVEIDPVVVELAREHLDLPRDSPERRTLAGWDARAALSQLPLESYDEIVLDTYANQTEIPAHLSTLEFFAELRERLAMGGVKLVANVGGFGLDDPVVEAMARTAAAAFAPDRVLALRVPFSRNFALLARRGSDPPEPGSAAWGVESAELAELLAPMNLEGAWRWFPDGRGALLTDDHNPIERLQERSIQLAAEAGRP